MMSKINFNKIKPLNKSWDVDGMTTPNIQSLLNALCKGKKVYMEIGSYQGATVLGAAHGNPKTKCFAVDNFSQFDKRGENERILREAIKPYENITLIKEDSLKAIEMTKETGTIVDVFFFDGEHTYKATLDALLAIRDNVATDGYIVVDDTNWQTIQDAVDMFVTTTDFEIVFEKKSSKNGDDQWWNGITVLQRKQKATAATTKAKKAKKAKE
jgi:cephalosporin hydroxylase